jgi:hypothetical protein
MKNTDLTANVKAFLRIMYFNHVDVYREKHDYLLVV